MVNYADYIRPELLVLVPVLMALGTWFKSSKKIPDWAIPFILCGIGILLSVVYILAGLDMSGCQQILMAAFTAVTQGVLCAAVSVFGHQAVKQVRNKDK